MLGAPARRLELTANGERRRSLRVCRHAFPLFRDGGPLRRGLRRYGERQLGHRRSVGRGRLYRAEKVIRDQRHPAPLPACLSTRFLSFAMRPAQERATANGRARVRGSGNGQRPMQRLTALDGQRPRPRTANGQRANRPTANGQRTQRPTAPLLRVCRHAFPLLRACGPLRRGLRRNGGRPRHRRSVGRGPVPRREGHPDHVPTTANGAAPLRVCRHAFPLLRDAGPLRREGYGERRTARTAAL